MKREINLLYASSVMIGVIVGSGIFISPTAIMERSGSVGLSLILWSVSGMIEIMIALCYCELACMFPKAGGEYAFVRVIVPSELPAFLVAWNYFMSINPAFYAILAITSAKYILQPFFSGCAAPEVAVKLLSIWILISVVALNSAYVKYIARVQTLFTVCKLIPLFIIIIIGMVDIFGNKNTENVQLPFNDSIWSLGAMSSSVLTGLFTYGGWQYLFTLCEEVTHPERIIPRATVISLCVVICLYLMTNFCYMVVLAPTEMIGAEAVALEVLLIVGFMGLMSFAEKTIGWFALCIPLLVVFSTVGAMNGSILGGSRISYAAGRDQLFPQSLSFIHVKYQTPWVSVWSSGAVTVLYILSGDVVALIDYQVFTAVAIFILCIGGVLWLRWKEPDRIRPFKVPIVLPIMTASILTFLMVMQTYRYPRLCGVGILLSLTGVPVYLIFVWGLRKTNFDTSAWGRVQLTLQKCLQVAPEKEYSELEEKQN